MSILKPAIPVLRIFSLEKAKEFYLGFLGFTVDWEYGAEENSPVYMQVSRGSLVLHLSEHYGDGVPGTVIFIPIEGIEEFQKELAAKQYKYMRPGILDQDWGMRELHLIDPFGNRLRFAERKNA